MDHVINIVRLLAEKHHKRRVLVVEVNGSAFQLASAVGVSSSSASSTTEPMVILIWRADIFIGSPAAWIDTQ
jgi:hypothetical protein